MLEKASPLFNDLPITFLDLIGYGLPGAIIVAAVMLSAPDLLPLWTPQFYIVVAIIGYLVGHIVAAFHRQSIGLVGDRLCGSIETCFIDAGTPTKFGQLFVGVRPVTAAQRQAFHHVVSQAFPERSVTSGGTPEEFRIEFLDVCKAVISGNDVHRAHERRLRTFTILFGNLTFASIAIFYLSLAHWHDHHSATALYSLVSSTLCFLAYCRYRLYRLRYIYVTSAAQVSQRLPSVQASQTTSGAT